MLRRKFIEALGSATIALPLTARAQPAGKMPTFGFLGTVATGWRPWTDAFVQRLQQLGWTESRTITIVYRWDEGRLERDAEVAAEFVRLKPDVIVTNDPGAEALKNATTSIPIVFALAPDPIGAGLVTNLARPGGNITGLSLQSTDLAGKRLELLHGVVPHFRKLAMMFNGGYPVSKLERDEVAAAARPLSVEIMPLEIHGAEDIAPAFASLTGQVDSLYVVGDALTFANRTQITKLALSAKLPGIFSDRLFSRAGGLMSYGPNFQDLFKRAAELVDKILRGAKPGDIPVEQPTKFELAVNLKTAEALGLTVPPTLLARAEDVIE
jgi:putative tryptophan/tyrosine transport system substrate-binding protein